MLLENLDIGESYTVLVREKTKFAAGEYGKLTVIAAPKAVTGVTATLKRRGVRVNYNSESEAAGYLVYRNDGSGYKQIVSLKASQQNRILIILLSITPHALTLSGRMLNRKAERTFPAIRAPQVRR